MFHIFGPANLDGITATVQNWDIVVIIRQVRKEPDVMCRIEEYNYALF
jgi:hypothetical protein